jgi:hypothetical protein
MRLATITATVLLAALGLATFSAQPASAQCACIQPDNGNGTVDLPPGCDYLGHFTVVNGLPAGTTIEMDVTLTDYANQSEVPGGPLGGDLQNYEAVLMLSVSGTGALAGFNRFMFLQVTNETASAPRVGGDAVQDFDTEMLAMQGALFGDPDFDFIRLEAGSSFGLPSPGHTTLTRLGPPGSDFQVDSFFDVFYRIEFQGAPGSILQGFGGATEDQEIFSICGEQPTQAEAATWGSIKAQYR